MRILLGITGSIAAYKALTLIRLFIQKGWEVKVVMSEKAKYFITPLSVATLTQHPPYVSLWDEHYVERASKLWTAHVDLAEWADVFLIAPATANTIFKIAHGVCDNLLTAVALSFQKRRIIAPAMDEAMWKHSAVQENVQRLRHLGWEVLEPEEGFLASGLYGKGRMPEPETILHYLLPNSFWEKQKVLITVGATREYIDPIRFLSNPSTGRMGMAIAQEALQQGAEVLLIKAYTEVAPPQGAKIIPVESAEELYKAVKKHHKEASILFFTAAVSDFTPEKRAQQKIKKEGKQTWSLLLKRTPDALQYALQHKKPQQYLVGFALETHYDEKQIQKKLQRKPVDLLVFNLNTEHSGFTTETNRVTLFFKNGKTETLPLMSKRQLAKVLLDKIAEDCRD